MKIKIVDVRSHRNGSAGTGFHVVRFDEVDRRLVGVVFPERRSVAVLDLDVLLGGADPHGCDGKKDGPYYEDELRQAVLRYEIERAGSTLSGSEWRNLLFGVHLCRTAKAGGLILDVPDGVCVVCGEANEMFDESIPERERR